ncbi:ATP-binding protein [Microbacterium profundi]|uniref:ATP-binding protein n=1 Tax=Microbacterium profundi TaxID=450380 RepID=UPI001F214781|nr:ATP-binding protein [Microbacterium profundi]MCE7483506.1 ATP-binding protein [Microbacterium profundi]
MSSNIVVKTHIGRDIIQSAQLFKTPEAAVWEYVVNSLQYVDPGVVPNVKVTVDVPGKKITIQDNGSGMDHVGLQHFFTMHGENKERRAGVPGRGKFGTGKSAAFGIGARLTVSTTKDGKRQTVELSRKAINDSDGSTVPVNYVEENAEALGDSNGTTLSISEISVKLAKEPVVALIERHLSAFQGSPVVTVNGRACEIVRPSAAITKVFNPTPEQAVLLGNVELLVKAASAPLDDIHRGVQVTIGTDNLVAVETAGVDTKEYGKYLFGHIDCPELDNAKYDPVAAYTNDRSMKLNPAHPVVQALIPFIGASLEKLRQELVEEGKKAKADADRKRLKETTNKIEQILNADLKDFRERVEGLGNNVRRRTPLDGEAGGSEQHSTDKVVDPGGDEDGRENGVGGENTGTPVPGDGTHGGDGGGDSGGENASPAASPDVEGDRKVAPAGAGHSRMRGGLSIDYDHYGADYDRYRWAQDERKIVINLDHPVVKAAKGLPDEEATYRRVIWEIAFTAYAVALADLQFERDPALMSSDATYEIRDALRRVWANAGALYAV